MENGVEEGDAEADVTETRQDDGDGRRSPSAKHDSEWDMGSLFEQSDELAKARIAELERLDPEVEETVGMRDDPAETMRSVEALIDEKAEQVEALDERITDTKVRIKEIVVLIALRSELETMMVEKAKIEASMARLMGIVEARRPTDPRAKTGAREQGEKRQRISNPLMRLQDALFAALSEEPHGLRTKEVVEKAQRSFPGIAKSSVVARLSTMKKEMILYQTDDLHWKVRPPMPDGNLPKDAQGKQGKAH